MADAVGISLAGACAVHCLAAPAMAGLVPVRGLATGDAGVEWAFLLVSLASSAFVLAHGCVRSHGQWRALLPLAVGASMLVCGRLFESSHPTLVTAAVVVGATGVVVAHLLNMRWCRRAVAARCARPATVVSGTAPPSSAA